MKELESCQTKENKKNKIEKDDKRRLAKTRRN